MHIIKKYPKGFVGSKIRANTEQELFAQGYKVKSEEEIKEWQMGKACCLALIFLPLFILAKKPYIRVTYEKDQD